MLALATALLLSPLGLYLARQLGGMQWHPLLLGPTVQLWRLAPGLPPDPGLRLVLVFCLMQSVHYAMWLHMLPDDARARSPTMSFRASYRDLRRDLGVAAIVVAASITAGIAAWALLDLHRAGEGYFRMVRFHGLLEVMAAVLLIVERDHRRSPILATCQEHHAPRRGSVVGHRRHSSLRRSAAAPRRSSPDHLRCGDPHGRCSMRVAQQSEPAQRKSYAATRPTARPSFPARFSWTSTETPSPTR